MSARRATWLLLTTACAAGCALASCNFDAAYERYCDFTPGCRGELTDAGEPRDSGAPDAGPRIAIANCHATSDCGPDEACEPHGGVCVPTCHTAQDCPAGLTECAPARDEHGQPTDYGLCQCTSSRSCAAADPETTCNPIDHLCEKMCESNLDCFVFVPARECDSLTGTCGLPECTSNEQCTNPALPRCSLSEHRCAQCRFQSDCAGRTDGLNDCVQGACVAFSTCNPLNTVLGPEDGPDTCRYGQICVGPLCGPVDNGDCSAPFNSPWPWKTNPDAKPPVVVSATGGIAATSSECPQGISRLTAEIRFYAPNGLNYDARDPSTVLALINFVPPSGFGAKRAEFTIGALPPSGATSGRLTAGICGPSAFDEWAVYLSSAMHIQGNSMCLH